MEERLADAKGRVYLGKWYANKKLYMVDLEGFIVLTPYSEFARELEGKSREEIEKLLSSISPEEVREAFRDAVFRRVEGAVNG
ncbi:MAG: VapB-type antitoxin [Thermoprotei archaeon]